jgi:hypothetical protein
VEVRHTFEDREEAERAWGWLRRSGLTPALRETGDGHYTLEVPAGQQARAEGILQAVAGVGHVADLPRTPWWQRVLTWENLAGLSALVVGIMLVAFFLVVFRGWVRWFGMGAAVVFCLARVVYYAYSGFSAANEHPEPISMSHGVITQDEAAVVSYRRAWVRQTWSLANARRKAPRGSDASRIPGPRAPGSTSAEAPIPRPAPPHLVRCHRCERLIEVSHERCPFCTAPRPGRP